MNQRAGKMFGKHRVHGRSVMNQVKNFEVARFSDGF